MVSERSGIKGDFLKCYVEIRLGKKFERKFAWLGKKMAKLQNGTHLGSVFTGPECQEENLDYILQNLENKFCTRHNPMKTVI